MQVTTAIEPRDERAAEKDERFSLNEPAAKGEPARRVATKRRGMLVLSGKRRVPSPIALRGAQRHSRRVRLLRVLLPASAVLLTVFVGAQAMLYKPDDRLTLTFAGTEVTETELRMMRPEFTGTDARNHPFRITSAEAVRDNAQPNRIAMNDIEADIAIDQSNRVSMRAGSGVLDTASSKVALQGGIEVFSDSGIELTTQSAHMDLRTGRIEGRTRVEGEGPMGEMQAGRFAITENGRRVRFEDKVHLKIVLLPPPPSG